MNASPPTPRPPSDMATLAPVLTQGARGRSLRRLGERYALLLVWIATVVLFGVLEPNSFLRSANFTSMFSSQAVLVVLTYALLVSLTAGEYDLSAAPVLTLSAMVLAILNTQMGVPVGVAIVVALVAGGDVTEERMAHECFASDATPAV